MWGSLLHLFLNLGVLGLETKMPVIEDGWETHFDLVYQLH